MFQKRTILLPAIMLLFMNSCENKKAEAPKTPPVVPVTLDTVKSTGEFYYDAYPATVTPLNLVELRPQVSGYITGIYFKDGDRVRKGQLLYAIDEQLYAANYQQAAANLKVQQANEEKAEKDANRYHELDKNDAVAKQLVDNADAALKVAQKQADAARAALQAVQTNVRYTKIYAPFDGVIGISAVKVGAPVSAGQTLLNTVSTDNTLAVDINIDQKQIYRFSTLLNEKNQVKDSIFLLAFGNDVYPEPGTLSLIDRTVNPQTGTIKARLVFPNEKKLLIAGMNGTVRVKANQAGTSLVIPYKAVTEQLGEYFVYVPGDSNKVSQRKIQPGKQLGNNVIVTDGLTEGELVVVQGVQNLKEGSVITTKMPAPAAKKP
ncbi:MAG: efflux RND transporter periplasmic adaptor subunit [Bacteroidetes bacterium]|jgi:membrane fusion protein (multidrug efflux system)|nr:efflux RND transporter periplasmic adaptor subunit [Bacteroidota bacterium]